MGILDQIDANKSIGMWQRDIIAEVMNTHGETVTDHATLVTAMVTWGTKLLADIHPQDFPRLKMFALAGQTVRDICADASLPLPTNSPWDFYPQNRGVK
jgi:hypothetical protein